MFAWCFTKYLLRAIVWCFAWCFTKYFLRIWVILLYWKCIRNPNLEYLTRFWLGINSYRKPGFMTVCWLLPNCFMTVLTVFRQRRYLTDFGQFFLVLTKIHILILCSFLFWVLSNQRLGSTTQYFDLIVESQFS